MKYVEIKDADEAYRDDNTEIVKRLYCYSSTNNPDGPSDRTMFVSFECVNKYHMHQTIDSIKGLAYAIAGGEDAVAFTLKEELKSAPEGMGRPYEYVSIDGITRINLWHYNHKEQAGKTLSLPNLNYIGQLACDQSIGYGQADNIFSYLGSLPISHDLGFALTVVHDDEGTQILDCGMDDFDTQWKKIFTSPNNENSEPTNPKFMPPSGMSIKIEGADDGSVIKEIKSSQAGEGIHALNDYTITNVIKVSATSKKQALLSSSALKGRTFITDGTGYAEEML